MGGGLRAAVQTGGAPSAVHEVLLECSGGRLPVGGYVRHQRLRCDHSKVAERHLRAHVPIRLEQGQGVPGRAVKEATTALPASVRAAKLPAKPIRRRA